MLPWRTTKSVTRTLDSISISSTRRQFTTSRVHLLQKVGIANLLHQNALSSDQQIQVNGWIRSVRKQKRIAFVALGDGSTIDSIQAVLKPEQAAE
jgi:asparaginyl-tRNA synthetase